MQHWNFERPTEHKSDDHAVTISSDRLKGKKIALFISASIASYRTPDLVREFRRHGAEVRVFATPAALDFVSPQSIEWTSLRHVVSSLSADAEHLEGDYAYDLFLLSPASYNTINKVALGIADNAVTTALACAIGCLEQRGTPIVIAPCMNGIMHNSILVESMKKLRDLGCSFIKPRQEEGKNKLPEIPSIIKHCCELLD